MIALLRTVATTCNLPPRCLHPSSTRNAGDISAGAAVSQLLDYCIQINIRAPLKLPRGCL
jgi:hypothetical protein